VQYGVHYATCTYVRTRTRKSCVKLVKCPCIRCVFVIFVCPCIVCAAVAARDAAYVLSHRNVCSFAVRMRLHSSRIRDFGALFGLRGHLTCHFSIGNLSNFCCLNAFEFVSFLCTFIVWCCCGRMRCRVWFAWCQLWLRGHLTKDFSVAILAVLVRLTS
jgi:hypothetical protein